MTIQPEGISGQVVRGSQEVSLLEWQYPWTEGVSVGKGLPGVACVAIQ